MKWIVTISVSGRCEVFHAEADDMTAGWRKGKQMASRKYPADVIDVLEIRSD
jgi:hypothetical protein